MRCPYCGGLNPDNSNRCRQCGRDIAVRSSSQPQPPPQRQPLPPLPPSQSPYPPSQRQQQPPRPVTPVQVPPFRQPQRPAYSPPQAPPPRVQRPRPPSEPALPVEPTFPDAPAPFPPRTLAQMQALEQGAQPYTLVSDDVINGKRIVRISYARCAAWQQVATLLKALNEYQTSKYNTIIIQGVSDHDTTVYAFTNGQLVLDHNVRLGSQVLDRYQVETGNGFSSDSVRIVLSE